MNTARDQPIEVGVALLASAEGYTPRATNLIDAARERLGTLEEVATALAANLPQPKQRPGKSRRRRRRKKSQAQPQVQAATPNGGQAGETRPEAEKAQPSANGADPTAEAAPVEKKT